MKQYFMIGFIIASIILSGYAVQAQSIVINEIMASNKDAVFDADYHQSGDWIELYNSGLVTAVLDGYYLTDDPTNLQKWRISSTNIAPNQYLLVWADGYDRIAQSLHTNFKLSASGEWVALVDPGGAIVDSLGFGQQFADISFGREADHIFNVGYLKHPTPAAANYGQVILSQEQCPTPSVTPESGYFNSVTVSVASPGGDAIVHYTLDGSTPTPDSPVFTTPMRFDTTVVFRARSFSDTRLPGEVVTRTFLVGYRSKLPVASLVTLPRNMWSEEDGLYMDHDIARRKEWERFGVFQIIPPDGGQVYSFDTDYRLFGRTAIYLPEKSFSFFPDSPVEYPLFPDRDFSHYNSFILRSASDDWDNMMFADAMQQLVMSRHMNIDTQAYQPAVLFINGQYFGIHNFREKYNEDYFKYHYDVDENKLDLVFVDYRNNDFQATVGEAQGFLDLLDYAESHDLSEAGAYNYVLSRIDLDNYLDYIVAECYVGNVSWRHNVRVWRSPKVDNKWRWVLFDLDRGMLESGNNTLASMINDDQLLRELIDNPDFKEALAQRFFRHINNAFQPDAMIAVIDSVSNLIIDEMPNHIDRWAGKCGNNACGISSMEFWNGQVERRREFARQRPASLIQQISTLLGVTNTIQLSLGIDPVGSGSIILDGQTAIDDYFSGVFVAGDQRQLHAQPSEGYSFDGWYIAASSQMILLPRGSVWSYWDEKASPGDNWTTADFDDSAWASGPAQLGYGDGDEATVISYGGDEQNKNITYWFRRHFTVSNLAGIESVSMELLRDDGAIVYINGQEVVRSNMPEGPVDENTTADGAIGNENDFDHFQINKNVLQNGDNIVAVEVHQTSHTSSDVSFDLELTAATSSSGNQLLSTAQDFSVTPQQDLSLMAHFNLDAAHKLPAVINADMTLSAASSPYVAETVITVQPGAVLTLEPGVRLLMAPSASIIVSGSMSALGTADAPILIKPLSADGRWGGLSFASTQDTIRFAYVTIQGATTPGEQSWQTAAVSADQADLRFNHVRILNVNDPFALHTGSVRMNACELDGNRANDDILHVVHGYAVIENCLMYGDGEVDFDVADNSIFRGNKITVVSSNSNQDAFDIGSGCKNVLIEGNTIIDATDKGVSVGEGSTAIVRRNVFVNCGSGIGIKDNSYADVINNTFYRNVVGIRLYEKNAGQGGGSAITTNNIFADTQEDETRTDEKSNVVVAYSLSNRSEIFGINNIKADPLFVDADNLDFHLMNNSPAIDAGDPESPKDPDGTRADIGAFYYDSSPKSFSVTLNEICPNNISIIADPAGEYEDWIELYNDDQQPFELEGLFLTDDLSDPGKWRISGEGANATTIAPQNVLLIWLDDDLDQEGLHAPFKLNAAGEEVALYYIAAGDTVQIDALDFDAIGEDKSMARLPDGSGDWLLTDHPSPGQLNSQAMTVAESEKKPTEFALLQNYPNPFNPQTTIRFALPTAEHVRLEIYDLLGRHVKTLQDGALTAGWHQVSWDATNDANRAVSAGVYFYSINAENFKAVKKLLLIK